MDSPLDSPAADAPLDISSADSPIEPSIAKSQNGPTSLLSLPDELLKAIFDLLAESTPPVLPLSLTLVCRRISHIARERLYRDIDLPVQRSSLLSSVFDDNPRLAQHVQGLVLEWPWNAEDSAGADVTALLYDAVVVAKQYLRFPGLLHLRFVDVPRFVLFTIADIARPPLVLSLLRSLTIDGFSERSDLRSAPDFWTAVANLPELVELTLDLDQGIALPAPCDAVPPLTRLQRLRICGTWIRGRSTRLADLMPNLHSLEFKWSADAVLIDVILDSAPTCLRLIDLSEVHYEVNIPFERYLARYPRLSELVLCSGYSMTAILPLLQSSAIESLTFVGESSICISDQFLLDLVAGPNRMKRLEFLDLKLERWEEYDDPSPRDVEIIGDSTKHDVHELVAAVREELRPDLPPGTTCAGLLRAIELAAENDIAVDGRLGVAYFEHDFNKEVDTVLVNAALLRDNYDVLVAYDGQDGVGAAIRRARPSLAAFM